MSKKKIREESGELQSVTCKGLQEDDPILIEIYEAIKAIKAIKKPSFFLKAIKIMSLLMIFLVPVLLCSLMLMHINCPAWIIATLSCAYGGFCSYKYAVKKLGDNVFYIWT